MKLFRNVLIKACCVTISASMILASTPIYATENNDAKPLEGRIIMLDPGHGTGSNVYEGYDEGLRMFDLTELLIPKLEELGATAYSTRYDSINVSLTDRVSMTNKLSLEVLKEDKYLQMSISSLDEIAKLREEITEINRLIGIMDNIIADNELGYTYYRLPYSSSEDRVIHDDLKKIFEYQEEEVIESKMLFISLHSNATGKPYDETINGIRIYRVENDLSYNSTYYNNYTYSENNIFLSQTLIDYVGDLGFEKTSPMTNNFFVNREMNIPSILAENGFHTNEHDRNLLLDDDFLNDMADEYCEAIIEYFSQEFIPKMATYSTVLDFCDVSSDAWYADVVEYSVKKGLFNGVSEIEFVPRGDMSRAMIVTVIKRIDDLYELNTEELESYNLDYVDVLEEHWYYSYLVHSEAYGYLDGVFEFDDYEFSSSTGITREETAQILYNLLKDELVFEESDEENEEDELNEENEEDEQNELNEENEEENYKTKFLDDEYISDQYKEAILKLSEVEIINGDDQGNFQPKDILSRVEVCSLIKNICEFLENETINNN